MVLMHLFSFEFVAFGLIVVTLAFYHRLKERCFVDSGGRGRCRVYLGWPSPGKRNGVQLRHGSGGPAIRH